MGADMPDGRSVQGGNAQGNPVPSIDSIGDSIGFDWDSIEIETGLSKIRLVVCFPIGNNNRLNLPD
jgi:hypothetical protein